MAAGKYTSRSIPFFAITGLSDQENKKRLTSRYRNGNAYVYISHNRGPVIANSRYSNNYRTKILMGIMNSGFLRPITFHDIFHSKEDKNGNYHKINDRSEKVPGKELDRANR